MIKRLVYFILVMFVFASCRQNKDLIYLQNIDTLVKKTPAQVKSQDYKIQENDILYVRIFSMNKEVMEAFNGNTFSTSMNTGYSFNDSYFYYLGYTVNDSGFIKLPIIGDVFLLNLTESEAQNLVQLKASLYIKDANVSLKLANFQISVLGEVIHPGTYYFYDNQVTLLEVIGKAGDLTDYGNRKNILIIRTNKSETKTFKIDLTDRNLLLSETFYLQPNDVVYIEPLKTKGVKLFASDYGTILTAISSTLTALVLIYSLVK